MLVKRDFKENKLSTKFNENPHVVTEKGSILTASPDICDIMQNSTYFKKITLRKSIEIHEEEEDDELIPDTMKGSNSSALPTPTCINRPVRTRHEPLHFKDYVRY